MRALRGEGRKARRHHDRGGVLGVHPRAADVHAQPLQHGLQALLRERRVVELIARAVEADDQAVADQHVVAHALDVGEVLDARKRGGGKRRERERQRHGNRDQLAGKNCGREMTMDRPCSFGTVGVLPVPCRRHATKISCYNNMLGLRWGIQQAAPASSAGPELRGSAALACAPIAAIRAVLLRKDAR